MSFHNHRYCSRLRVKFSSPQRSVLAKKQGFTLVEALVAMTILSIGFLGTAGLMVRMTSAQRLQRQTATAQTLTKDKVGQIARTSFSLLGTGSSTAEKLTWGAPNQEVETEGPLNAGGYPDNGSIAGPFRFTRSLVVCMDNLNGGASAASQGGDPCGDVTSSRPDALICDVTETDEDQAIVRVLTTYRDRNGRCHTASMQQVLVSFQVES